jgi:hypothetical protein
MDYLKWEEKEMEKKTLGLIITIIGIIVLIISLFADFLGIGGYPGIGMRQTIGIIISVTILVIGYLLHRN